MSQENETAEHQPPVPPSPKTEVEHLIPAKDPDPEPQKTQAHPGLETQPPQQNKKPEKKTVLLVLSVLVVVLVGALFFLIKERARAVHDLETKMAQMESRMQTLQDKQNTAWAQNERALESLKKDLQKLKEQTGEHFAAEDRILQELRNTRTLAPTETANSILAEQNPRQTSEPPPSRESAKPSESQSSAEPERGRNEQTFIDFVETVLKKIFELAGKLFQIIWDFLSDFLKKTV